MGKLKGRQIHTAVIQPFNGLYIFWLPIHLLSIASHALPWMDWVLQRGRSTQAFTGRLKPVHHL